MKFFSAARRSVIIVAVLALTTVGASGAVAQPASAATAKPRHLSLLTSAKPHRAVPKDAERGYSTDATRRKPPKLVSEIVADRTATSSTWRDADGSITVRSYATPQFYKPSRSSGWMPIVTKLSAVAGKAGWWQSGADSWQVMFGPAGAMPRRLSCRCLGLQMLT